MLAVERRDDSTLRKRELNACRCFIVGYLQTSIDAIFAFLSRGFLHLLLRLVGFAGRNLIITTFWLNLDLECKPTVELLDKTLRIMLHCPIKKGFGRHGARNKITLGFVAAVFAQEV